jgi:hypothetical protein
MMLGTPLPEPKDNWRSTRCAGESNDNEQAPCSFESKGLGFGINDGSQEKRIQ